MFLVLTLCWCILKGTCCSLSWLHYVSDSSVMNSPCVSRQRHSQRTFSAVSKCAAARRAKAARVTRLGRNYERFDRPFDVSAAGRFAPPSPDVSPTKKLQTTAKRDGRKDELEDDGEDERRLRRPFVCAVRLSRLGAKRHKGKTWECIIIIII